jgi:hypothetical protein
MHIQNQRTLQSVFTLVIKTLKQCEMTEYLGTQYCHEHKTVTNISIGGELYNEMYKAMFYGRNINVIF